MRAAFLICDDYKRRAIYVIRLRDRTYASTIYGPNGQSMFPEIGLSYLVSGPNADDYGSNPDF